MQKTHLPTSTSFRDTKVRKLEIEGNFINPIKVIYQKKIIFKGEKNEYFPPISTKGEKIPTLTISVQYYNIGSN